jgi:hypothetical protein
MLLPFIAELYSATNHYSISPTIQYGFGILEVMNYTLYAHYSLISCASKRNIANALATPTANFACLDVRLPPGLVVIVLPSFSRIIRYN